MASKCGSCGAAIKWIKTSKGRPMPVDPKPITVVTNEGHTVTGRQSHFASCPNADKHRKKGDRA